MFMSAIPIAQVMGAPISGALLEIHWLGYSGWRWLLVLEGVPAVIAGFVALFYLTDSPRDARWLSADERDWITGELDLEARAKPGPRMSVWQAFWRVFQDRDVILLTSVYFLGACGQYGFSFWLPKMIQKLSGFGSSEVALIAALPFLASWPAMLLLSWSSDRTGERRWHTAAAYVALAAGLAGSVWAGGSIAAGRGDVLPGRHRHQRAFAGLLGYACFAAGGRRRRRPSAPSTASAIWEDWWALLSERSAPPPAAIQPGCGICPARRWRRS